MLLPLVLVHDFWAFYFRAFGIYKYISLRDKLIINDITLIIRNEFGH
jgi:hypothetical protein